MLLFYFDRKLDQMMAAIEYELTFRKCTQITLPNIWPLQFLKTTFTWGDDLRSLALGGASVWTPILLSDLCGQSVSAGRHQDIWNKDTMTMTYQ